MKLKVKNPFSHEGKNYKQGDTLDVPDHQAHELISKGHVEEHKEGAEHKEHEEHEAGGGAKSGGPSGGPPPGGQQKK